MLTVAVVKGQNLQGTNVCGAGSHSGDQLAAALHNARLRALVTANVDEAAQLRVVDAIKKLRPLHVYAVLTPSRVFTALAVARLVRHPIALEDCSQEKWSRAFHIVVLSREFG